VCESVLQNQTHCFAQVIQETCNATAADINMLEMVTYSARFSTFVNTSCTLGESQSHLQQRVVCVCPCTSFVQHGRFYVRQLRTLPGVCRGQNSSLMTANKSRHCGHNLPFLTYCCNCNCNWCTCIAPPTRRPRAHHRVNPYLGARRQKEAEMFSDHGETSPSVLCIFVRNMSFCYLTTLHTVKVNT